MITKKILSLSLTPNGKPLLLMTKTLIPNQRKPNAHKQSHSVKPGFGKYKMSGGYKWLETYKVIPTAGTLKASLQAQRKLSDQCTLLQGYLWQQTTPFFTEDYEIQNRWVEHFNTLLHRNSSTQQDFLRNGPQHPPQPPSQEFDVALRQMRQGKAAGPDNIPTEPLTHGCIVLKTRLYSLILKVWEEKHAPSNWKDAPLVTIFKKGNRRDCGNYRGICS